MGRNRKTEKTGLEEVDIMVMNKVGSRVTGGAFRVWPEKHTEQGDSIRLAGGSFPSKKGLFPPLFRAPPAHNWPQPGPDFPRNKNICYSMILRLAVNHEHSH